jgi:hypothetical protein
LLLRASMSGASRAPVDTAETARKLARRCGLSRIAVAVDFNELSPSFSASTASPTGMTSVMTRFVAAR